jgi:TPR repeat protein
MKRDQSLKQARSMGGYSSSGSQTPDLVQGGASDSSDDVVSITRRADAGEASAQYELATRYQIGTGVPEDPKRCFELALKAAQQGHMGACLMVGDCYHGGHGVDLGYKQALDWYRKASELATGPDGDPKQSVAAFCNMARMYAYGQGVDIDQKKAEDLIAEAVLQENPDAQFARAMILLSTLEQETDGKKRASVRR